MSAQVGVLLLMDQQIAIARALSADAWHAHMLPKLVEARATVAELVEALRTARKQMAHKALCSSVRPTSEWAEHGSINFDQCVCDIRIVDSALARAGDAA